MTEEVYWYPQDQNGDGDGQPLGLPEGTRDDDPLIPWALANWAMDRDLDYAVAIREDGAAKIKVYIQRCEDSNWKWRNLNWEWLKDPVYEN